MKIDELMEGACKKCKICIGATGESIFLIYGLQQGNITSRN